MAELRVVEDLAAAAAELFIAKRPRTVALSGGQTPRATYESLASLTEFPWESVDFFFGDERCVPPDDSDSNFRMANETLLSKVPSKSHPMSDCDPGAYEKELAEVFGSGVPKFDLVFLGLGEDGHTASLFPDDPALEVVDRNVMLVERPDHQRITLTFPVLNAAKLAVFLVEGKEKQPVLAQLMSGADIPAARVDAATVLVLADSEAAGG